MTKEKLKICAVTTTRADYGIMRPLLLKLDKCDWCDLVLVVTGTHLLKAFGHKTRNEMRLSVIRSTKSKKTV